MQQNRDNLRLAIIGVGRVAQKSYLPLLRTWPSARIIGVVSKTEGSAERTCSDWEIDFGTTNLDALLDQEPDAAFVLTPRSSHAVLAERLMQAGVDVFVEKPPTESSAATRALAELAERDGRVLMFGFNRRYALLYQQAKSIFEDLTIQSCVVEKHRPSAFHPSLYNNYLEDTIHQIDLLRFLCGDVKPEFTSFDQAGDRLLGAVSVTRLASGGAGIIHTSLQSGAWQEGIRMHGASLSVEVSAFRELRVIRQDKVEIVGPDRPGRWIPDLEERGFQGAIEHFFDCVRTRELPHTNALEAFKTQELVEALVELAGEPRTVVPNPREGR